MKNGYICFHGGKKCEVIAETALEAQREAAKIFKAKRDWEVSAYLCERADGSQVTHSTASL
jgi:hypothetical protein